MHSDKLDEIVGSYKWIKVKAFEEVVDPDLWASDEDYKKYMKLVDHHKKETEFLINKCRDLAQHILDERRS